METIKLTKLKYNKDYPRSINKDKFFKLRYSILCFGPKMLKLRKMIFDENNAALGGNMRLKTLNDISKAARKDKNYFNTFSDNPEYKNSEFFTNKKLQQALTKGEIPVDWIQFVEDFTEEDKREFIIKDNVSFGDWDFDELANNWDAGKLVEWGMDIEFDDGSKKKKDAEEDGYSEPDEVEVISKGGDLIEFFCSDGRVHRLLCGDSTKDEDVKTLMGEELADMVFTDPPYGVNIKGGKNNSTIAGDITQTAIPFSFELAVRLATKKDARLYFCGGEGNIGLYSKLYERYCRQLPRHLIWVKNGFVMKPNGYHNQYEIIFHGYKPGGGGLNKWFAGRTEDEASDVWQIKRDPSSSYVHPTQKPIELPSRAINNSSPEGGLIYEPFCGSGSTLIAAHQLGRVCYAVELDPYYCTVIIDRMLKLDPELTVKINGEEHTPED